MRALALSATEKATITLACQEFIDSVLKPQFLPAITGQWFRVHQGLSLTAALDAIETSEFLQPV